MRPSPCILLSMTLALAALPAGAERLCLKGGRWLETDGPWRLDGRRVVFRTTDGVLRSLAASELDLDRRPKKEPDATPVSLQPWAIPGSIPEPAPLPQPPRPVRPDRPRLPPDCLLSNPEPETPLEIVCAGRTIPPNGGDGIRLDSDPAVELWSGDVARAAADSEPQPERRSDER